MVLNGAGNDVISLRLVGKSHTLQGEVICLGSAAGKDNFLTPGTNKVGNLAPCLLYSPFCLLPVGIDAGRVTKDISKIGEHCLHHLRVCWCGSGIIKVYPSHFLTLYNISNDRVDPHPLANYPSDALLDFSLFSLQF
ncbi:hypothetical protein ES703_105784 [subsurface metagenome]